MRQTTLWPGWHQWKYVRFTNLIYHASSVERHGNTAKAVAAGCGQGQRMVWETMYSEVLTLIASFEAGIAHELELELASVWSAS